MCFYSFLLLVVFVSSLLLLTLSSRLFILSLLLLCACFIFLAFSVSLCFFVSSSSSSRLCDSAPLLVSSSAIFLCLLRFFVSRLLCSSSFLFFHYLRFLYSLLSVPVASARSSCSSSSRCIFAVSRSFFSFLVSVSSPHVSSHMICYCR